MQQNQSEHRAIVTWAVDTLLLFQLSQMVGINEGDIQH
jgi:hypothetical protein